MYGSVQLSPSKANGSQNLDEVLQGYLVAQSFFRLPVYQHMHLPRFQFTFCKVSLLISTIDIVGDPFVVDQLKTQFQRLRPSNIHNTYAFPSGHTTADVFIMGSTLACCQGTANSAHVCRCCACLTSCSIVSCTPMGVHVAQLSPGIIICRLDSLMQLACMLESSSLLLACVLNVSQHSGVLMN